MKIADLIVLLFHNFSLSSHSCPLTTMSLIIYGMQFSLAFCTNRANGSCNNHCGDTKSYWAKVINIFSYSHPIKTGQLFILAPRNEYCAT